MGTILDPNDPASTLRAFVKVRGSLAPEDVVCWFKGNIYGFVHGSPHKHLFSFEGFNIGRAMAREEGGWSWLSREAVFYCDPVSGEILEEFQNPYTGQTDDVVHVLNDPVNGTFALQTERGPWTMKPDVAGDAVHFATDVFLMYPNPLPPADWPEESGGPMYQGAELFRFVASKRDIEDDSPSAPCHISWVRMAPWVPWMRMGVNPGWLVYHTGGQKLGGYDALPAHIKAYVEAKHPEYQTAPTEVVTPNETSWTYYRKLKSGR